MSTLSLAQNLKVVSMLKRSVLSEFVTVNVTSYLPCDVSGARQVNVNQGLSNQHHPVIPPSQTKRFLGKTCRKAARTERAILANAVVVQAVISVPLV